MKTITKILGTLACIFVLTTAGKSFQGGDWVAPMIANVMVNPLKGDADATMEGKKLYNQMCSICHGDKGKGDGIAGMNLDPRPADHTSAKVQNQSDGAIFWKMSTGKAPMAPYASILTETQRWQLVNYIREFGKTMASH